MIRSLYSGVAGLKTQQTKMDVIGNNIANVGTYGFKSDRATFKDVYYQTTQTATASTGNAGGTNAKQIGYGNSVGSIDTNTKTSAMSSTGYGLDIAIAGEGFLQVMGADGNIMYTKAGMLDIDAEGNLVDVNGNFVLGVSGSDTSLPPSSNKIKIDLPYLDAQASKVETTINNVDYTITSSNPTSKANVNFTFVSSSSLPIGQKMSAKISGQSITVTVNANEEFSGMSEINAELNKAIKAANGNVEHPAGEFTISMVPETSKFSALDVDGTTTHEISLTGAQLVSSDFGFIPGEVDMNEGLKNLFNIKSVGEAFKGDTRKTKFETDSVEDDESNDDVEDENPNIDFTIKFDGERVEIRMANFEAGSGDDADDEGDESTSRKIEYVGIITLDQLKSSGNVLMTKRASKAGSEDENDEDESEGNPVKLGSYGDVIDSSDSFVLSYPSLATLRSSLQEIKSQQDAIAKLKSEGEEGEEGESLADLKMYDKEGNSIDDMTKASSFEFSFKDAISMIQSEPSRSLGLGQSSLKLAGGTEGGEQTVANLTSISINSEGCIVGTHEKYGVVELGRIDLATFSNPAGLQKVGSTYFETSLNSGDPIIVNAGTEGTGQIMASTLEASNVDLSNEFSDMIMTQRGFQASSRVITVSDTMLEELINLKR